LSASWLSLRNPIATTGFRKEDAAPRSKGCAAPRRGHERACEKGLIGNIPLHEIKGVTALAAAARSAVASKVSWAGAALAALIAPMCGAVGLLLIPGSFLLTFLAALIGNRVWLPGQPGSPSWLTKLPDPELFSDLGAQSAMRRLIGAREALRHAMRDSPRGSAFDLSAIRTSAPGLERRIEVLLARTEYLGSFLKGGPRQDTVVDKLQTSSGIDRLRAREHAALSEGARAAYRESISEYESHLQTVAALEAEREELLATVEYLLTVIESLPARVTHLQHLRLACCDGDASCESVAQAAQLADRLNAFVETAFAAKAPPRSPEVAAN
jgi:hypothetical protein